MRRRLHRRNERGFAMLLVFAMAAAVVVTLYMEAPRLAQQALRQKEQLLIDRGEQYQRAIQVFMRTVKKPPQSIDELEKFQDKRYLRQRYKDPFTGDAEWRLIHVNNGVFTDSKVYGPKKDGEDKEPRQTFVGELPSIGNPGGDLNDPNAQNPAAQRRASDRPAITSGQGGENQPVDPNAQPGDPNQAGGQPRAVPGLPFGVPAAPGQPGAAPVIPGAPGVPGMPSFQPANPIQTPQQGQPGSTSGGSSSGGFIGGSIPAPGGVSNSQTGGTSSGFIGGGSASTAQTPTGVRPGGGQAGVAGGISGMPGGFPGGSPGQVPTAAADLIRQILTTPRPGGMPGAQGVGQGGLGNGIAGIASKREATGIKIYNERTRYDEWEFVYDQSKELKSQLGAAGVNSQGTNQPGAPLQGSQPGSALGGSGSGMGTGFGGAQPNTPSAPPSSSGGSGFIGGSIPTTPTTRKQ